MLHLNVNSWGGGGGGRRRSQCIFFFGNAEWTCDNFGISEWVLRNGMGILPTLDRKNGMKIT